jgi:hypothetical protein
MFPGIVTRQMHVHKHGHRHQAAIHAPRDHVAFSLPFGNVTISPHRQHLQLTDFHCITSFLFSAGICSFPTADGGATGKFSTDGRRTGETVRRCRQHLFGRHVSFQSDYPSNGIFGNVLK